MVSGARAPRRLSVGLRLTGLVTLLCGIAVVAGSMDLYGMHRTHRSLEAIYHHQVVPLQQLKTIADAYAVVVVDAVHKANAGLITGEDALREVRAGRGRIEREWQAFLATSLTEKESRLAAEADQLFVGANRELGSLERALAANRGWIVGRLNHFIGPLYAAIDPISDKVAELVRLQLQVAEVSYSQAQANYVRLRDLSIVILALGILLGALLAYRIICDLLRQLGGEPGYAAEIANRVAGGDLSVEIPLRAGDAGSLLFAMRNMVANLAQMGAERRQMEERLREQAQQLAEGARRKDEFLATLAHELRNPLAPISNALQLLKRAGIEPAMRDAALAMGERQLSQLVRLVDELLDVSRISRGKVELRKEPVTLQAILQAALETARPQIDKAGHRLLLEIPAEPVRIHADLTRLAQAVTNLLINAAKFTEPGGEIRLTARCQGDEVLIAVQDSGIGMAATELPKLFELFAQIESSRHHRPGGLGIGLALVKSLVVLHGGRVEAASAGIGRGSTFTIHLPRCTDLPAVQPGAAARDASAPPAAGRRILIVDDDADVADSTALLLSRSGHEVRTVYDGATALEAAATYRPEIVLLDIGMPGMDGHEVARRLRAQPAFQGTLLVALTGWGQEQDRRRSREAGFDHHLVKPVDPDVLEAVVRGAAREERSPPAEGRSRADRPARRSGQAV
jgi:signal transduction histidine kinase/FixJ family two-component response regulator